MANERKPIPCDYCGKDTGRTGLWDEATNDIVINPEQRRHYCCCSKACWDALKAARPGLIPQHNTSDPAGADTTNP